MNDPVRLLEGEDLRPAQHKLLLSAKGEVPSDAVLQALLGGVTLGSMGGTLTDLPASVSRGGAVGGTTSLAAPNLAKSLVGWISLGAGLVTVGTLTFLTLRDPDQSSESSQKTQSPAALTSPTPEPLASPISPSRAPLAAVPTVDRISVAPERPAPRRTGLAEEVSALEEVRRSLRTGAGERSLTLLRAYTRRFPRGMLRPEADTLRVEAKALAALQDDASSKRTQPNQP